MKIIIPIYLKNKFEENLLDLEINRVPLAFSAVDTLCQIADAEIHIFTEPDSPLDYSHYPNVQHHRKENGETSRSFFNNLPDGAFDSLLFFEKGLDNNEILVIIDYRNPTISGDLIHKAIDSFLIDPEKTLVSVTIPKDNPVQFNSYYRIIEMDVACFFETNESIMDNKTLPECLFGTINDRNYFITNPGPFDWSPFTRQEDSSCNFYCLTRHDDGFKAVSNPYQADLDSIIYIKEGENSARRLLIAKDSSREAIEELTAVSLVHSFENMSVLLLSTENQKTFSIYLRDDVWREKNLELRLYPFSRSHSSDKNVDAICIQLNAEEDTGSFNWMGRDYYGPVYIREHEDHPDGYIVSIVSVSSGSNADFSEPMVIETVCSASNDGLQRINSKTGEIITGRQQFPDIYQMNSSIAIMSGKGLDRLIENPCLENLRGFMLDDSNSRCIRNELDVLNIKISKRNSES